MKVTIKKLSAMPYAQAHVEIDADGNVYLFSYYTCVASIGRDGWLEVYGLHSMTTRKRIGAFVAEYVQYPNGDHMCYQTAKMLYENGWRFNVNTGEIEDTAD